LNNNINHKSDKEDGFKKFVEISNPHSWFLTAGDLHEQACGIYDTQFGRAYITKIDSSKKILENRDIVSKSVFLLAGFSLENMLKAYTIYENPEYIANGKISKQIQTHSLTKLHGKLNLLPFLEIASETINNFEIGLNSWARYPCGLTLQASGPAQNIRPELMINYRTIMNNYAQKLVELLKTEWRGPHNFRGEYTFSGEYWKE
jgi:hypothetical protein